MIENNELVAYRYKTTIFGFIASTFILNYIIRHHTNMYPDDKVSRIMKTRFYMDNLVVTSNNPTELRFLYRELVKRMSEGGFDLRSWNSNSLKSQGLMNEDGKLVTHNNNHEKVLGYKYFVGSDSLQFSPCSLNPSANTKRTVLSNISKVFDPLGLFLPVNVREKVLMRDLWAKKLGWDEIVPTDSQVCWSKLCNNTAVLFSMPVPRMCVSVDEENSLYIFCDASKRCYGFSVYNVCNGNSQLVFAKAKVAPIKPRSLPTLELMAAFLALKCLPMLLDSYQEFTFKSINLAVDSQIVLSWILSENDKTKNVFTQNRIKDICLLRQEMYEQYKVDICLKYIASEYNPADCLTRGLTFNEFVSKKALWFQGPPWISGSAEEWPTCLSEQSKQLIGNKPDVFSYCITSFQETDVISIDRHSSLNKLFRVTAYIYKFIFTSRKISGDSLEAAKMYWIKRLQRTKFSNELDYLQKPDVEKSGKVPELVNKLDFFLTVKVLLGHEVG